MSALGPHLPTHRLGATDLGPEESAHLSTCAECAENASLFAGFVEDGAVSPPGTDGPTSWSASSAARYTVLGPLGGMSRVQRAYDAVLQREVAQKTVRPELAASLERRFLREARLTARLEHPNIVPVYDLAPDEAGRPMLILRVVDGATLESRIRAGELGSLRERVDLLLRVCDAVAFAHEHGVVHRDLKPANIMVGRFGEVQVMDFGIAGEDHPAAASEGESPGGPADTRPGSVLGTPRYMSPEQARGEAGIGPASDVYALGATLWELLVGRPAFPGDRELVLARVTRGEVAPPRRHDPSLPRDLDAVVLKAMAADPSDRYPSVGALQADLKAFLEGHPVSARAPSLADLLAKWVARNRAVLGSAAATTAVAAVVVVGLLIAWALDALEAAEARAKEAAIAREMASAAQFAERVARLQTAEGRLREAQRELELRPDLARTALLEARAMGSATQQVHAGLGLDTLVEQVPTPVLEVPVFGQLVGVAIDDEAGALWVASAEGSRGFRLPDGEPLGDRPDLPPTEPGPAARDLHAPAARLALTDPRPVGSWSPRHRLVAFTHRNGVALIPAPDPSAGPRSPRLPAGPTPVAVAPDGTQVVFAAGEELIVCSRAARRVVGRRPLPAPARSVRHLDGRRLLVGTDEGLVLVDLAGGGGEVAEGAVRSLTVGDDGVAVATLEGGARLRVGPDGVASPQPAAGDASFGLLRVGGLAVALAAEGTGAIEAHRWPTGEVAWRQEAGGPITSTASHGDALVVGTAGGQLVVLDVDTGERRWSAQVTPGPVGALALSDTGVVFVSAAVEDGAGRSAGGEPGSGEIAAWWRGEPLWRWPVGGPPWTRPPAPGSR